MKYPTRTRHCARNFLNSISDNDNNPVKQILLKYISQMREQAQRGYVTWLVSHHF